MNYTLFVTSEGKDSKLITIFDKIMDSDMVEARDIMGISVPFAAGVATGAVLCPFLSGGLPIITDSILLILICSTTLLVRFDKLSDRSGKRLVSLSNQPRLGRLMRLGRLSGRRIFFAGIFIVTGIFCSLNYHIASGIPEYGSGIVSTAAAKAVGHLRATIDAIPYPSETTGPLVKALLTGDKSDLPKEITGIFRDSGASHILALSGLHLGVLYLLLTRLTSPLGNSPKARKSRYSLIIVAALFYSIMTGATPSIIRAFLFITINETARLLGRKREPVRVLLAALTVQLALKPDVISSVGFQLSYMAMAGIFLLYPTMERIYPAPSGSRLSRFNPFRKIWNAAMLSISCQIFTGPLAWYYFHTFPKYFILTNLVALPLTSAIMTLSVATIALSFLGICPEPLVILNDHAMQALVFCLEIISGLDNP